MQKSDDFASALAAADTEPRKRSAVRLGMNKYAPPFTVTNRGSGRVRRDTVLARNRHAARPFIGRTAIAQQRIRVVVQPAEVHVVTPGLLHELELTLQARVHAQEVNATRTSIVFQVQEHVAGLRTGQTLQQTRIEKRWSVDTSPPEESMRFSHAQ